MRIAICLSGHLRNYEETFLDYTNNILKPLQEMGDVDVFIHTWDKMGPVISFSSHKHSQNNWDKTETNTQKVIDKFQPKEVVVENYEQKKYLFYIKNFTSKPIPNSNIQDGGILFSTPMYYKIWACFCLANFYSSELGYDYDVVVRYRIGVTPQRPIDFKSFNFNLLNVLWSENGLVSDQFAFSNMEKMRVYSNVFTNLDKIFVNDFDFGPERIMYHHLQSHPQVKINDIGYNCYD